MIINNKIIIMVRIKFQHKKQKIILIKILKNMIKMSKTQWKKIEI
jgi:hypothetical protein